MAKDKKNELYTYYRIDFEDWGESFDYTIVANLDEVRDYLQMADVYLDDPDRKTKVIITGVGMTTEQYSKWLEKTIKKFDK